MRLFRLGQQSLWIDEQFTLTSAGLPGRFALHDLLENVHGPLHTLVVAGFAALAGTSEWVLRLPSALAGIALVPAIGWLASRWSGRETVTPAVWLTAGSPFLVWYSQECRNYAFLLLASVLATAALLELQRRCTPAGVLRYAAAAAAGSLSNLSFALLVPLHLRLWLAAGPTRRARLVALAVTAGAYRAGRSAVAAGHRRHLGLVAPRPRRRHPHKQGQGFVGSNTFHVAALPFALHAFAMGYAGGPTCTSCAWTPWPRCARTCPSSHSPGSCSAGSERSGSRRWRGGDGSATSRRGSSRRFRRVVQLRAHLGEQLPVVRRSISARRSASVSSRSAKRRNNAPRALAVSPRQALP